MKKFLVVSLCLLSAYTSGQQLDRIGKKGGIKVSGGVGLANNFYWADGISNRLNPYSYVLSGNLNISIYGFSLPFSFSFSNMNYSYTQPFNIVGLSPTYKRWTFHGGYRNMSFSPYTLNGHNFLGTGVEYKGDVISVAAMGGRLLKAVQYDSTNLSVLPAYQRLGAGVKLTYHSKGDEISVTGFYAKDNVNSINLVPASVGLKPQENMVWSIGGKKVIQKLTLQGEYARSAWTKDLQAESASKTGNSLYFIKWNQSTVVYNAMKASASYAFSFMNVGMAYERIDPEYRTLGAYYFNNDLENVTANVSTSFWKKKITLSANGGLQHDDLKHQKASSMKRTVGSLNVGFVPTNRLSINLSYSNFFTFVNIKPVDVQFLQGTNYTQIDTLNYTQLSTTYTGSVNYKLSENDDVSRTLGLNSSYMQAANIQYSSTQSNNMLNGGLMVNQVWKKTGINVGVNVNGNQTVYGLGKTDFYGAGITGGVAAFKKKLRISLGVNVTENYENSQIVGRLYAVTNSYSVRLYKKHVINASLRYSGRAKVGEAALGRYNGSFNEFIGSVGYNYNF